MARVEIASQAWGSVTDAAGNAQGGVPVTIKNLDTSNATTWTAVTGGTSSTGSLTTDSLGGVPRFIEEGTYTMTVGTTTRRVEAVRGASSGGTVSDATSSVKGIVALAGDLGGSADSPTVPGLAGKAPLASPTFTGTPIAPTPSAGDNTTKVATTAYVRGEVSGITLTGGGVAAAVADPGSSTSTWFQTRAGQPVSIRQRVNTTTTPNVVTTVPAVHAGEAWQHLRAVNGHDDYPDSWSYFLPGWDGVSGTRILGNTWLPYMLTGPGTTKLTLTAGAASLASQGARALFDTFRTKAKEFGDPNDYGTARGNYMARQYAIRMCGIVGDPTQEVTMLANLYASYLQPMTLTQASATYPQAAPSDIFAALEMANEPGYNNAALSLQLQHMAAYMAGSAWANVPIVLASLLSMNDVTAWGDQRARAGLRGRLTYASPHPYPGGGAPDEGHYDYSRSFYANDQGIRNAPGQPVWVTETGYHTMDWTNDPHPGVSETAQAAYTLRLYLVNIRDLPRGSKTFNYQLIEGWPTHDPGFTHPGEQGFGYIDTSGTNWRVKPAYWVHRAAILLMEDTGASSPLPDADAPIQITSGRLSTTDVLPVYWSDGRFGAWIWDSRVIYDRNAALPRTSAANITVTPYNLTFTVPAGVSTVKVADPVASETALTTLTPSGGTVTVACSANNPKLVIFQ